VALAAGALTVRELIRDALRALDIRRLLLGVHDAAFPGDPRDDTGRGAPLSAGGLAFLRFAARLGFHGLQLGPQGETTEVDPSPYDSTIFSRSTLSIAPGPLLARGLVSEATMAAAVEARPAGALERAAHRHVFALQRKVLDEAFVNTKDLSEVRQFWSRNLDWLDRDGLYAALAAETRDNDWTHWPDRDQRLFLVDDEERRAQLRAWHTLLLERHAFGQWLAHEQHAAFRAEAQRLGMLLSGDLQVGIAHQDAWSWGGLYLPAHRMGAPPSRTNPDGQPWGYRVLHPDLYGEPSAPGPAVRLFQRRVCKMLGELDGLRLDHPHGWIDPWVYAAGDHDALHAVQSGARLFSAPDLQDRPELQRFAIARPDQLDRAVPRHADGWVRALDDEQVASYARLFDTLVEASRAQGRAPGDLIAEVLSTQPLPVGLVLRRHGLGRMRVTQKCSLTDPRDVYRSENAAPEDWILVGSHDTEPIWRVAERWVEQGVAADHARYLSGRLVRDERDRARWAAQVASDPQRLAGAKLAELFAGPARNAMVFFPDLLGMREVYNRPGTVGDENWSLRVPPGFEELHAERSRGGAALDLPRALCTALQARGGPEDLIAALERAAGPDPAASA
jgi:4-alpha-glucanotransferase